jgi:cytochrome c oxidase subunit 3/cytochrome o ubiquinol oxidase subunit 3
MSESRLSIESSVAGSQDPTQAIPSELVLTSYEWGMIGFLVSEAAFFCTLIVVYLAFVGAVQSGPTPAVLSLPLVIGMTACLLCSSVTVHLAAKSVRFRAHAAFMRWWSASILLGIAFLAGTGCEWNNLIGKYGLTISRNLFGTTYYTLVGFHALHVTVGVIAMLLLLVFARNYRVTAGKHVGVDLVSWYWHFVDVVWVVVFAVVYLIGR